MNYQERLENLAKELVTPERFGRLALIETVEMAQIYEFPQLRLDIPDDAA